MEKMVKGVKGKVEIFLKGKSNKMNKMKISTRKRRFHAGKKSGKVSLPLLKNIPLTPLLLRHYY